MTCYVVRDVDQSYEDVADGKVSDEDICDVMQTTMTTYDMTDKSVSEQRDTEYDEVTSTQ